MQRGPRPHCGPHTPSAPHLVLRRAFRSHTARALIAGGLNFEQPLPSDQVELSTWCCRSIERVLKEVSEEGKGGQSWTRRWLEVLKKESANGFHPDIPPYGFGDALSYKIVEGAVGKLKRTGAVRHGAECFNYYFPQELDDHYLVMWGGWSDQRKPTIQYMDERGLRHFLAKRVTESFTFPLNPKWVLVDSGWYPIFEALCKRSDVSAWYPPSSGLRELITAIHKKVSHFLLLRLKPRRTGDATPVQQHAVHTPWSTREGEVGR